MATFSSFQSSRRSRVPQILVAALLAATWSGMTLADTQLSPPVRIVALQLKDGASVLRIAVRRRIEIGEPAFNFNPADCGSLSLAPNVIVLGTYTNPYVFDYPLGVSGRTAARQRQTLDALYTAFATTRIVQLSVRDDSCSEAHDSPVVTGVSVIH